jgi:hypothetical protein
MSIKKEYEGKDIIIQNLPLIFELLVKGNTITEICKKLGVSRQTWYNLYKENLHFRKMLEEAEEAQKQEIKSSLVNKCVDKEVVKEKVLPNGKKVKYREFIPADFNAIKFYLLNKLPDEFKDKQEVTVKNTIINVEVEE